MTRHVIGLPTEVEIGSQIRLDRRLVNVLRQVPAEEFRKLEGRDLSPEFPFAYEVDVLSSSDEVAQIMRGVGAQDARSLMILVRAILNATGPVDLTVAELLEDRPTAGGLLATMNRGVLTVRAIEGSRDQVIATAQALAPPGMSVEVADYKRTN